VPREALRGRMPARYSGTMIALVPALVYNRGETFRIAVHERKIHSVFC